ncbi:MAG: molybdopterin-dependent oxidoreductase [Gemmatimonadaceae bacterium]
MSKLDRRTFVRSALIASAAAAIPRELRAVASDAQGSVQWKRAPCRLCGVGCGLLVGIQGGRAVAVKGDPESPVSRGLACVKGYYSPQILYGRDRITRAQVRRGGTLVQVPLGEALDLVASRIREASQRHGADSVALYGSAQWTAEDAFVAARLFRGALGSVSVDTSARLHTASASAGLRGTFGLTGPPGSYDDVDQADVLVLWNINLAESDPVLFSRMLERRRANPSVRIVELANLTSRTSYAADRSLLFSPPGELVIANAICNEIVARKMERRDFVQRYVAFKRGPNESGQAPDELLVEKDVASDWNAFVRFLADYAPERAERLSGLAADEIRWLASLYGDPTRKVVSVWGPAVNRQSRGTWVNNALHNIHLLVGKVSTPGNAAIPVAGQPGGAALLDDALAHHGVPSDSWSRQRTARAWGVPLNKLDARAARPALAIFRALERGDLRFLWIQATNPMVSLPNLARYRAAMRRAQCFVVVSEGYPTPTTDVADVVLPAALWIEREGMYVNGERRVQHLARLVNPPGDAASDARHMVEVARRLGHGPQFPWPSPQSVAAVWNEIAELRGGPQSALPNAAALRAGPGRLWPAPDGRETRWRYNTQHDPAAERGRGEFDFYGHEDHRAWIWLRPFAPPPESPDRDFPFWFSSGRVVEHWGTGSLTQRIPTLHRAVPHAYVEINPDDARAMGVRDGELVRLTSRRGSLTLEARIDYRCQPPRGLLFAPGFDEGALVNILTPDDACPISGQPGGGACAVRVERVARIP